MIAHGVAVGWKLRILSEVASHDLRIALYGSDAALGPQTASYTPDGEAQGAGYEAGGQALQNVSAMGNGSSVELRADDPVWPNASLVGVRGALVYDNSVAGKPALFVLDFGEEVSGTNAPFELDLPAPLYVWL
jgi:hypothetical protein